MAVITIGYPAADYANTIGGYPARTILSPVAADGNGILNSVSIWMYWSAPNGCDIGTFSGSGTSWSERDHIAVGAIVAGAERTFTGVEIDVRTGDLIGAFPDPGGNPNAMEFSSAAGGTSYSIAGNQMHAGVVTYTGTTGKCALEGSGVTYELATITTEAGTDITKTSCTGNGNVSHDGGDYCSERGICYCLRSHGDPDINDSKQVEAVAGNEGAIVSYLVNLIPGTYYNLRAYATNLAGTSYGATVEILTLMAATYWEVLTEDRALKLDNTTEFIPTADYHPSTKKYVDDFKSALDGGGAALGTDAVARIDQGGVIPAEQIESMDGGFIADLNNTMVHIDLEHRNLPIKITSVVDTYTILIGDELVICNKSTAFTVTLPAATGTGRVLRIKSIGAGVVTISASAETIDGSASINILQWESVDIIDYSTGVWAIV